MLTKRLPAAAGLRSSLRRNAVVVRASSVDVTFKIHRHVEYGQSLLLVGGPAELGNWDGTKAVPLEWSEGDNWTAKVSLPAGASAEYKYIIKRKDSVDWCPGQNKAVALPAAVAVEVSDSWEHSTNTMAVTVPAEAAAAPAPVLPIVAEVPAPAPEAPMVAEALAPAPATPIVVAEAPVPVHHEISAEAVERADHRAVAVSTVENIEAEELDATLAPPAPAPAPISGASSSGSGFLANNIVQAAPKGAIALGASDPVRDYEEADKFQVVEVGAVVETSGATATLKATAPVAAKKALDVLTVSELKSELKRRGLSSLGTRRELITRLQQAGL